MEPSALIDAYLAGPPLLRDTVQGLTDEQLEFRRVEYDVEKVSDKIYNTPDLDNMLGDRLKSGR